MKVRFQSENEPQRTFQRGDGERIDRYTRRLQELVPRFQNYKIPVIRVRNIDVAQATDIFTRLNKGGCSLKTNQLIHQLPNR